MSVPDEQYRIRLTGTAPPPPSTNKKRGRGGGAKKSVPQQQQQQRHVLTVSPTLTFPALRTRILDLFGVVGNGEEEQYEVLLMGGYPPKKVDGGDGPVRDLVDKNESLIVRFEPKKNVPDSSSEAASGVGKKKKRGRASMETPTPASPNDKDEEDVGTDSPTTTAAERGGGRRSKRQAAKVATASFPEVIREQNRLIAEAKKKTSSTKKKRKLSNNADADAAARARAAKARAATAAASRRMASLPGRKLDGSYTAPSSSSMNRRGGGGSKSMLGGGGVNNAMKSEEDVSTTLLTSLSSSSGGGGGGGKVGAFLRSAMKNAVGKSYEQSRAGVRVSAVLGGKFEIRPKDDGTSSSSGGRLGGGGGGGGGGGESSYVVSYVVKYSKGIEGRGHYEEEVEILSLETLKSVVQAVHATGGEAGQDDGGEAGGGSRMMLQPQSMAQLSPRVFWSLADHFPNKPIEEALRELCPDLDWEFLDGRSKKLSEKAKENLRQERLARGEIDDDEGTYERSAEVVEAVENAMERMHEEDRGRQRERMARAALARFGSSATSIEEEASKQEEEREDEFHIVTPDELDEDELRECIRDGMENLSLPVVDTIVGTWVQGLLGQDIRNWRQLANADSEVLCPSLKAIVVAPSEDAGTSSSSTSSSTTVTTTERIIESWIEVAQLKSIDEMMLLILDNNQDIYEALRESANAGTPKDLSLWSEVPGLLLEEVNARGGGSHLMTEGGEVATVEDARKWCQRAKVALGEVEWLDWYATPVE